MEQIFNEKGLLLDMNKLELISNEGEEFSVYKYDNSVLKIYKKDYKLPHLTLEELNFLKSILTQRILMPAGTLWNNDHELIGYEMPLIANKKNIDNANVSTFFEELEIIRNDLITLCKNQIILMDINIPNTIYNGRLYLIDPGNYIINDLSQIIYRTSNKSILKRLKEIPIENDNSRLNAFIESLSLEERQDIIKEWNYNKINDLIIMLLFYKDNIDFCKFREIINFINEVKEKHYLIYNLDVLKMFFNEDLSLNEAVNIFINTYIRPNSKERRLFLNLVNK